MPGLPQARLSCNMATQGRRRLAVIEGIVSESFFGCQGDCWPTCFSDALFPQLLFPVDDQTYWSPGSWPGQSLAERGVGGGRVCLIMQMVTDYTFLDF